MNHVVVERRCVVDDSDRRGLIGGARTVEVGPEDVGIFFEDEACRRGRSKVAIAGLERGGVETAQSGGRRGARQFELCLRYEDEVSVGIERLEPVEAQVVLSDEPVT